MAERGDIKIDLIKLVNGVRILRLSYSPSGIALEMPVNSTQPLLRQKKRLGLLFDRLLAQDGLLPA